MSGRTSPRTTVLDRSEHLRPAVAIAALLALLAGCKDDATNLLAPPAPSYSRITPGASFSWSVPDRFGPDADGDGLTDYPTPAQINPGSWPVDFDACALPGEEFTWLVDQRVVATVTSCTFRYSFPAEGMYDVAVHVKGADGASTWAEQKVTVQDWLIVSFGDSYASGEGVPEVQQASDALTARLEQLVLDLSEAQNQFHIAQARLHDALEQKGLAQQILYDANQRLSRFLDACTIDQFSDIVQCANFLASLPGSFDNFSQAKAYLDQAVANATQRLNDAVAAVNAANAAVSAAQSAISDINGAIVAARAGFQPPRWQSKYAIETYAGDDECHRSANAAPARAARALEAADPHTSVTFLHLACTGAQMRSGRAPLAKQIQWADALIGDREIDAVLVSIGGNDAGFATLATACAVQEPCNTDNPVIDLADAAAACAPLALFGAGSACTDFFSTNVPTESAKHRLEAGLDTLPIRYAFIADESLPGLRGLLAPEEGPGIGGLGWPGSTDALSRLRSGRVYISEYVDMTKDDAGAYCTPDATDPLGTMPGFSVPELYWLDHTAAHGINRAVADAAQEHGWHLVTGIYAGYRLHGYCARDHWVTRLPESFLRQGDIQGIAHPANPGQVFSGQAIEAALLGDLYPGGLAAPPRAPDAPRNPLVALGGS